jgi:2-polyprenyl-3-methyl-5-hydroxy-6-metoxy-1,4-benzoquinol methylase
MKCQNCSFVFAEDIPTENELIEEYLKYPRKEEMSPTNLVRFEEYLDSFEKYRKTNNILEIGAGVGFFIKLAKERGWNVYATEYDDVAVQRCKDKGATVHQGKLSLENYENDFFDVIFSTEVIEHINNPREEVEIKSKILRTGGAVFITTPNFNSISRRVLGEKWNVIHYPEHLSYYTSKTLSKLFNQFGFQKVWIRSNAISINRIIKSSSHNLNSNIDEEMRTKASNNLFFKFAKYILNSTLILTDSGDSLKGFFIKK